jgi:hypothetical protein
MPNRLSEEEVRNALATEHCTLVGGYMNCQNKIEYTYEGNTFYIRFCDWKSGGRPHLNGGNRESHRWSQEDVENEFKKEDCELMSKYVNRETLMAYKFEDMLYNVTWASWYSGNVRPHINVTPHKMNMMKFLNENKMLYRIRYTFKDLKNCVFDFYLPDYDVLIDFDRKSTKEQDKKTYCIKNKIKYLIVSKNSSFDESLSDLIERVALTDNQYIF